MRFGLFTSMGNQTWPGVLELWRHAEATGWDVACVTDHFMPNTKEREGDMLEGWSTLSALAALVERMQVGTIVLGNTYRHPAVVAKMVRVLALGPLADAARAVAAEITRAADRARSQRDALAELSLELRQQLGVDPELGGLLARATREASDFLDTLNALEARGAHGEARELRARIAALTGRGGAEEP